MFNIAEVVALGDATIRERGEGGEEGGGQGGRKVEKKKAEREVVGTHLRCGGHNAKKILLAPGWA